MGKVRRTEDEPKNAELMAIQKVQNKLIRMLNNTKISDRVSSAELLERLGMLSVNQLNAQIKLGEMWKATHSPSHPTKFKKQEENQAYSGTRACSGGKLLEEGTRPVSLKTFKGDASRLWNNAPVEIKDCLTMHSARVGVIHAEKTIHANHARDVTITDRFVMWDLDHLTVNRVSSVRRPLAVITSITVPSRSRDLGPKKEHFCLISTL